MTWEVLATVLATIVAWIVYHELIRPWSRSTRGGSERGRKERGKR
jgi:hypothetical protein